MSGEQVKQSSRRYDSPLRREQALLTERRILDSARTLFLEAGYAGTSIAAIAATADVSAQTVYKGFGTKASLAKRLYDVTLVGDTDLVPLGERPEFVALSTEPDPRRALALYARVARGVMERVGALYSVLLAGALAGDPELRELVATTERERYAGTGLLAHRLATAGALRPGLTAERANDVLWTLTSPELYRRVLDDRGWPWDDVEAWFATITADALLGPADARPPGPAAG